MRCILLDGIQSDGEIMSLTIIDMDSLGSSVIYQIKLIHQLYFDGVWANVGQGLTAHANAHTE